MKTALILYTNGTEDIEVTAALDVLHRGGVKITTAAVSDESSRMVALAHGTVAVCDTNIDELEEEFDLIVVPGGPGTKYMGQNDKVIELLKAQKNKGKLIGAICAAPGVVLYSHGLIDDKTTASCYPGCECGKNFSKQGVSISEDGKIITARSANYAIAFGLEMLKALSGEEVSLKVARDLLVIE